MASSKSGSRSSQRKSSSPNGAGSKTKASELRPLGRCESLEAGLGALEDCLGAR